MRDNSSSPGGAATAQAAARPAFSERQRQLQQRVHCGMIVSFLLHPERRSTRYAQDWAPAEIIGINFEAPLYLEQPRVHLRVDGLHTTERVYDAPFGDQPGCWMLLRPEADQERLQAMVEEQHLPEPLPEPAA